MNVTRIIAVAAFVFHILVGCGWHQHGAVAAKGDGQHCSVKSHGSCHAATESTPAEDDFPSENSDDCEIVACVYASVQQVEVPSPLQVSAISTVPSAPEYDAGVWGRHELGAGELVLPHVRRHVALLCFLN